MNGPLGEVDRRPQPPPYPEAPARRRIAPALLLSQVRNTVPFIFDPGFRPATEEPHLERLRVTAERLAAQPFRERLIGNEEYFALCLAAHHATVASFVPTDVDIHIRFKLWSPEETTETIMAMAETVVESQRWSNRSVSRRSVYGPAAGAMSGHDGEWFSTAAAAYGALRRRAPSASARILGRILDEMRREERLYQELRASRDGIATLKAATIVAHNLGDLDRVIDLWELASDDPLRVRGYKAGHAETRLFPALAEAGALNKAMMAVENHRHFALRKPRCLRRSADYLLPIAPFVYEWGATIARHPQLAPEEKGEIAAALVDGWERLQNGPLGSPVGYARALAGLEEHLPGGLTRLGELMPSRAYKKLRTGVLRTQITVAEERFLGHWNHAVWKFLKK